MPTLRPVPLALALLALAACKRGPEFDVWILPDEPTTTDTLRVYVDDGLLDWERNQGRGYTGYYGEYYYGYYGYYYAYEYGAEYQIQYLRWALEGTVQEGLGADRVEPERTSRGQLWAVQVYWYDWQSRTDGVVTAQATIGNSLPRKPELRIEPESPVAGGALSCVLVEEVADADGDPVFLDWSWKRNGSVWAPGDGVSEVPAGVTAAGESWTCEAVPDDTFGTGKPGKATATIGG